ncbi:MAG: hypothetical protein MRY76_11775 [Pseudomonadales bacterium]|nr:hypothetical protein [Pseudomonadales bacterium]
MNWEAIGSISEVAGAVGVIVTLIYLAIQLRQNTKATQLTAVQNSMENSARFSELIATDSDLARIFSLGLSNPDELSANEMLRFVNALNVFMRRESVAYYLYREGTLPEELWAARVTALTGALNQPGLKVYLETSADSLPAEFREFVEQIVAQESTMSEDTRKLFTQRDP